MLKKSLGLGHCLTDQPQDRQLLVGPRTSNLLRLARRRIRSEDAPELCSQGAVWVRLIEGKLPERRHCSLKRVHVLGQESGLRELIGQSGVFVQIGKPLVQALKMN